MRIEPTFVGVRTEAAGPACDPHPTQCQETLGTGETLTKCLLMKNFRSDINTVIFINEIISPDLAPVSNRKCTLSVLEQLFITLRFYATGTFQIVVGDNINVHKTTVSRVVFKVSKEIAKLARNYIAMPTSGELREVKAHFYSLAGFPNVIGFVMKHIYLFNLVAESRQSSLEIEKDTFL
ncbi:Putative nuclease HARBI1 [Eumeta japonica]|uniref:Nuclease HARBI1 n=1 Tax=Eumeta variegata TaxID=151549 RepID=A0A4C1UUM6_EUMVA|nr:Putative nuclease HARBI1 [Eumeta japonica]